MDKLIKGIIIGGAIGSVVGITLAPKSGKETRQDLQKGASFLFKKKDKTLKAMAPTEIMKKEKKKGLLRSFFGGIRALFFGRKKS